MKGPILISFEGAIGVGKSTLLELIQNHLKNEFGNITTCEEPVDEWIKKDILRLSYEEPQLYSFPAQCVFFTSRIKNIRKHFEENKECCKIFITERSPFSDKIFWNLKLKRNDIPIILHDIYIDMWNEWQNLMPQEMKNPNLFIYLKVPIETSMKRIKERGRESEKAITMDYQELLMKEHDLIFDEKNGVKMPNGTIIPSIVINTEVDYINDKNELQKIVQQIIKKIKEIY
jgi:deoxyadenosine/deoxycytidine kinase